MPLYLTIVPCPVSTWRYRGLLEPHPPLDTYVFRYVTMNSGRHWLA